MNPNEHTLRELHDELSKGNRTFKNYNDKAVVVFPDDSRTSS